MSYVKLFIGLFFILTLSSCANKSQANEQNNHNGDALVKMTINGIVCSSCKQAIESKLNKLNGITKAQVFLDKDKNNLEIKVEQAKYSIDDVKKAIDDLGFEVISIENPQTPPF